MGVNVNMNFWHEIELRVDGVIPPCVIAAAGNCIWRERRKKEIKRRKNRRSSEMGQKMGRDAKMLGSQCSEQFEYYPTIKRRKKITSAIARVIFLSLFISEDYILAHDCTLQETQNQNSKKRTGLSGLN